MTHCKTGPVLLNHKGGMANKGHACLPYVLLNHVQDIPLIGQSCRSANVLIFLEIIAGKLKRFTAMLSVYLILESFFSCFGVELLLQKEGLHRTTDASSLGQCHD